MVASWSYHVKGRSIRSAAGKTTIARAVERRLFEQSCRTRLLDGDQLRHGLCGDLVIRNPPGSCRTTLSY